MNRADQRKNHYIYKITRHDGKYYIGMHSTDNLDDGYFGSGTLLAASIRKHGKEKHSKEIIEFLPCRMTLKTREKELVNEELLGDKFCMNLRLGGEGGGGFWNTEHMQKFTSAGGKATAEILVAGSEAVKARNVKSAHTQAMLVSQGQLKPPSFAGMKHSDETNAKIGSANAISQAGNRNSQYGTCWVKKDGSALKIKKEQLREYLENGYSQGRKS